MTPYFGDFAEDATVRIPFNTFDSNDPSASATITNLADADIKVHKDGGLIQIATDGATVIINFDGITGNHIIAIDTSVHADYSTGSDYQVRIEGTTVDAGTINAFIGSFSIENRSNNVGKTGYSLAATGLNAIASTATGMVEIAKAVWDRVLTGGTHNITNSAGKKVREIDSSVIRDALAQGAGVGNNQIQLDTGASSVDGAYDPSLITIIKGTGQGQSRLILQYAGTTKMATVDRNWKVNPDATSEFIITGHAGREHVNEGLAQAGTSTTITLNTLASSASNAYNGQIVFIRSGTGDDQARVVSAYNGTTKIATVENAWAVTPNSTSGYVMLPSQVHTIVETQAGLATEAKQDIIGTNVDDLKAGVIFGTAATGTLSVTQATTSLTGYTADQLIGRELIPLAGPADGEVTKITDYEVTNGRLTFDSLTLAMANTNRFKIV